MRGRFRAALVGEPQPVPPIWLMRQAGRYHAPYQRLRQRHSFETLCKSAELAAEVALAPVDDFDFDAAILFSDLLFPLEALGMGLSYEDGPPKLDAPLTFERVTRFRPLDDAVAQMVFQGNALAATKARLPPEKGLIGFVGGPWTLFVYAIEGTHRGPLARARASLDLYRAFAERMVPLLLETIQLQFDGCADIVMVFDTAAGGLEPATFANAIAGDLVTLAGTFPKRLGYYAKGLRDEHIRSITPAPWAGFGLDMSWNLAAALADDGRKGFVQGNFDPTLLVETGDALERSLLRFVEPVRQLDLDARRGWICGLGHGVLPHTPASSVRTFVNFVREQFA